MPAASSTLLKSFRIAARLAALALFAAAPSIPVVAQDGPEPVEEGSVEAGRTKAVTCGACHGVDGNSVASEWPNLAGQHSKYVVRQLEAYKNQLRADVGMQGFAAMLSAQDMQDVAAYFSAQTPRPQGADPNLVSLGEQIYRGGIPERGVAACIACHGPDGRGNPLAAYPRISGQHATYVYATLQAYASGQRRSDVDLNQMMRNVAELLFEDEMRALASYVQGLR
jgi:cytochrome c553